MNQDPLSHGLWEASAPAAPAAMALAGDIRADSVIIGGGFTGSSAAYHLARAGRTPVVLEAQEIGFGGAGRNVGLVNAGLWVMPDDLPAMLGETYGERLLTQLGEAPGLVFDIVERNRIACEAQRGGTLHCAVGRAGFREISDRASQWLARGADVELLDRDQAARAIGSRAYSGALLDRRAGTIQPLAYVRGLTAAAIEQGAAFHTRSAATGFEDLGDAWKVTTAGGSVTAPWVIVATDAYSTGPWEGVKREQVALPYFQFATAPLDPALLREILPGREGTWDTKNTLSSFRLDAAGRLIFGSIGALRGPGKAIHIDWGRRELARIFPQLGDVAIEHRWHGTIGMTDGIPRFHRHARNIYSISAYNGRGIAPGTTFGRDLARLAMGDVGIADLSLPLTDLEHAPFREARGAFYEVGSQLAHFAGSRF